MKTAKARKLSNPPPSAPLAPHPRITAVAQTRSAHESFVNDLVATAHDAVKVINASLNVIDAETFKSYGAREMVRAALGQTMQELTDAAFRVVQSVGKADAA